MHALAGGAVGLGVSRFFLGIGEGACFPAVTKGAVEWMPAEQRAMAVGIANGGSAFGAVLAPPLTAWIATSFGWRSAFLCTAMLGFIWLAAWLIACRALPAHETSTAARVSLFAMFKRPEMRRLLIARFLFDPVARNSIWNFQPTARCS